MLPAAARHSRSIYRECYHGNALERSRGGMERPPPQRSSARMQGIQRGKGCKSLEDKSDDDQVSGERGWGGDGQETLN